MHSTGDESVANLQMRDESLQLAKRNVLGSPALLAHEMVMLGMIAQVEHGRAVPEVDVVETSHRFQRVDGPVDRRLVDWSPGDLLGATVQLGCREVLVVGRRDHLTDRPTRCGDPKTGTAEVVDEGVGGELRH